MTKWNSIIGANSIYKIHNQRGSP